MPRKPEIYDIHTNWCPGKVIQIAPGMTLECFENPTDSHATSQATAHKLIKVLVGPLLVMIEPRLHTLVRPDMTFPIVAGMRYEIPPKQQHDVRFHIITIGEACEKVLVGDTWVKASDIVATSQLPRSWFRESFTGREE